MLAEQLTRVRVNKSVRSFRGDRLRTRRERMGLTQDELEKLLKFGKGAISRYENAETDPLPNQLVEMSRQLGVSVDWLLGLSDDPETGMKRNDLSPEEIALLAKYRSGELEKLAYDILGEALVRKPSPSARVNPKSTDTNAA